MASTFTATAVPATLDPLVEPADALTAEEVERYSRHLIIPEIGTLGQRRLTSTLPPQGWEPWESLTTTPLT
jgi:hypothetical protein